MIECCSNAALASATLAQHWVNTSCLLIAQWSEKPQTFRQSKTELRAAFVSCASAIDIPPAVLLNMVLCHLNSLLRLKNTANLLGCANIVGGCVTPLMKWLESVSWMNHAGKCILYNIRSFPILYYIGIINCIVQYDAHKSIHYACWLVIFDASCSI